jgi:hypothetical protein
MRGEWSPYLPTLAIAGAVLLLVVVGLLFAFSKSDEPQPNFGNIQGFGFLYYGWRHAPDGTATATRWIVALWLPLIPLRRQRVRVLTDFRAELARPSTLQPLPMGYMATQHDYIQMLEKLPLSGKEIALTLTRAYLLLPLTLLCPPVFIWQVILALRRARGWQRY